MLKEDFGYRMTAAGVRRLIDQYVADYCDLASKPHPHPGERGRAQAVGTTLRGVVYALIGLLPASESGPLIESTRVNLHREVR